LRNRLALWGITSRNGNPVSKSTVQRMLTNKTYIGFIVHKGETYQGNFPAKAHVHNHIYVKMFFRAIKKLFLANSFAGQLGEKNASFENTAVEINLQ